MAGWKPKARAIFSPREIVAQQVGPSTFRYIPARELDELDTYPSLKSFRKQRAADKLNTYDHAKEAKSKFAWQPTRWSTFNFNSFLSDVDDNTNLFVKEPENYITPTKREIRTKTNYWTDEDISRIKELSRCCYLKMIDDNNYIHPDFKNPTKSPIDEEEWHRKKELFDNVFTDFIPGHTPLEQAIAVNEQIRDKETRDQPELGRRFSGSSFEFKRDDYCNPYLNNQLTLNKLSREKKLQILSKISIIGDLGSQFKVEKECGEQEVANSDIFRKRVMRNYDQLTRLELYQRILPTFKPKLYTKNLVVNVPVKTSEKKQKIIILVDFSGSMDEEEKQIWVNALLIDRFRYVIQGEAEVFFSFFVHSPSDLRFTHIKNEEDVITFWKKFSNRPNGSFTNIGRIVKDVARSVKSKNFYNLGIDLSEEQPEILIVNDGQDEVGYDEFPYKVNAISLMQFSDELKDLCVATGGKQIGIDYNDRIVSYSKEKPFEVVSAGKKK